MLLHLIGIFVVYNIIVSAQFFGHDFIDSEDNNFQKWLILAGITLFHLVSYLQG